MSDDVRFDWQRAERAGVPEVVFAQSKSTPQLLAIVGETVVRGGCVLMTRVDTDQAKALVEHYPSDVRFHEASGTLIAGARQIIPDELQPTSVMPKVAIVAAGSSDHALVAEIEQCLEFLGVQSHAYIDVGVAGLWRLTELAPDLNEYPLCIAVAGMEGALFSVLSGLFHGPVIAVPSSVGYGVSEGGHVALNCALASCAPGIAVVNIDNGFGAAALACKMLKVVVTS